ncbi:hypothetical protein AHAS_Ahas17G0304300 [Arachis hypogaea]
MALRASLRAFRPAPRGPRELPLEEPVRPVTIVFLVLVFWHAAELKPLQSIARRYHCKLAPYFSECKPRITEGCELQMLKFSLFMVIGNIIGYATGSYSGWHTIFPFTVTVGCNISCANLKSAFYLDVGFMVITTLYQHHGCT